MGGGGFQIQLLDFKEVTSFENSISKKKKFLDILICIFVNVELLNETGGSFFEDNNNKNLSSFFEDNNNKNLSL